MFEPRSDLVGGRTAVVSRLKGDSEASGIGGCVDRTDANNGHNAGHIRIGPDGVLHQVLPALHFCERYVGACFRHRCDKAGILQWQEALGNGDIE